MEGWHRIRRRKDEGASMPELNLTAQTIKGIKPPSGAIKSVEYWDTTTTGFGLRVGYKGRKVYIVRYLVRGSGVKRRVTIGRADRIPLADARARAKELLGAAELGTDTVAEARQRRAAHTFADLCDRYLEDHAKPKKRSWRDDERLLLGSNHKKRTGKRPWRGLKEIWGDRVIDSIKRADVADLVLKLSKATPVRANRALAVISKMFNFAIDVLGWIEANPAARMPKPTKERPRDRVLSHQELARVCHAAAHEHFMIHALFMVRVLTLQRANEVARMRWDEIDWEACVWTQADNKARRLHAVPLTPEVISILRNLRDETRQRLNEINDLRVSRKGLTPRELSAFCFPADLVMNNCEPNTPIDGVLSRPMARIRRASGVKFRGHDLRRTGATLMGELGIDQFVIARVLNHVDQTVTGRVYNRYPYMKEKRAALETWAKQVMSVVRTDSMAA
jgi:integrase